MEPLASKIRPQILDDFVGQGHLVGPGKPLREAVEGGHLFSFILWGPPGSGKTTLARIYARALNADFHELSAVDSGKADIQEVLGRGKLNFSGKPLVLFIDEIHRFNKAQQDFLLPFVERGAVTLIGATTENPSFEVIPALLSRLRIFVLNAFGEEEMADILVRTGIELSPGVRDMLYRMTGGDARQSITLLENTHKLYGAVTEESLRETAQSAHIRYDKKGDEHYNTVSAFIKSMRAGQADAAVYYLARMVAAGEDPLFIARRMVIFASEDVGLAQPTALVVANAVFRSCETIGYPECQISLAHGAVYLAECKKDRRAYDAIFAALDDVQAHGVLPIPLKVRNAPTKLMKDLHYGKDYDMYDQESYLPEKLKNKKYVK